MGKSNGGPKWWFMLILLLVILGVAAYFLIDFGKAAGYFKSRAALQEENQELKDRAEQLAEEREKLADENEELAERLEGFPTPVAIGLVVGLIFLLLLVLMWLHMQGRNYLTMKQALALATEWIEDELDWKYYRNGTGGDLVWRKRYPGMGQAVDGDSQGIWYVICFAQDYPEGGAWPPGNQCVTVAIKRDDPECQIKFEIGMNAPEFCDVHGIKLQRNVKMGELEEVLRELDVKAKIAENAEKITG